MKLGETLDKRSLTKFKCPVCAQKRYRGNLIKVNKGSFYEGWVIKVCLRGECQKNAKKGLIK